MQAHNNNAPIIVDFNESSNKITIFDMRKTLLGEITSFGIIKYLSSSIYPTLFESYPSSSMTIEKYICDVQNVKSEIKINLLSHNQSPLMGNIEMLMKIYKIVHKCEKEQLNLELSHIQTEIIKKKIIGIVSQFQYLLLSYILKLIATISDAIKNDKDKRELKDMLLRYSVACAYNMSNFMKTKIEEKIKDIETLQNDMVRMGKVKLEMYKKIEDLTKSVISQNVQIQDLTKKLEDTSMSNIKSSQISSTSFLLSDNDVGEIVLDRTPHDQMESNNEYQLGGEKSSSEFEDDSNSSSTNSSSNSTSGSSNSTSESDDSETENSKNIESSNSELGNDTDTDYKFDDDDFYFTGSESKPGNINYLSSPSK